MTVPMPTGLDELCVRLHARHSRMAVGERLDVLCRLRSIPELAHELYPESTFTTLTDLQRRLVRDRAAELVDMARRLEDRRAEFVGWLAVRYHLENLKVYARGFATRAPMSDVGPLLAPYRGEPRVDGETLLAAEGVEGFASAISEKPLRKAVLAAAAAYAVQPRSFYIEAALDRGYLEELVTRADALAAGDRDEILPIVRQEVDLYNLMLATRGRFIYGLKPEFLIDLHVAGGRIRRGVLTSMLAAADLADAANLAMGLALDSHDRQGAEQGGPSGDPMAVEAHAVARLMRIAGTTFYTSHMGLGAAAAYAVLRRMELANLITLSEGLRAGLDPEAIRRRLIPRKVIPVSMKSAAASQAGAEAPRV